MTAGEIYIKIAEALKEGRPVCLTDGTVTQSIQKVEMNGGYPPFRKTLDVLVDRGWCCFPVDEIMETLEYPYELAEYDGELYLAPTWWIEL